MEGKESSPDRSESLTDPVVDLLTGNIASLLPFPPTGAGTSDGAISPRNTNALLIDLHVGEEDDSDATPRKGILSTSNKNGPGGLTINIDSNGPVSPESIPPTSPIIAAVGELAIDEGTPAAEALFASAQVKVTKVGKAARFLNAHAFRRVIKERLLMKKSLGGKRGKPPRVPGITRRWSDNELELAEISKELRTLQEEEGEEDEEEGDDFDMRSKDLGGKTETYQEALGGIEDSSIAIHSKNSEDVSERSFFHTLHSPNSGHKMNNTITLLDTKGKQQELEIDKKWKKRKKKLQKKHGRKSYVKGKVIDGQHELYALSIAVMLGLRYSISLTNEQLFQDKSEGRFWLESDDFMRCEKYVFRPNGNAKQKMPSHQLSHTFKFKDYSPLAFAYIRRMFGINEFEFLHSVCGNTNFIEFISNAKSGQFFFYSSDGKYMIKTMTNAESKFLRRILPHYFRHCAQNPNTLITKFLGMYRVKLYHLRRNVKFVVMNSVFDTDKILNTFYDLKGSSIGRAAKPNEDVKKDNDVRNGYPGTSFVMKEETRERMKNQLTRDCEFLKEMKIMDYSMLIGVHHVVSENEPSGNDSHSIGGVHFRDSSSLRMQKQRNSISKPNIAVRSRSSESGIGRVLKSPLLASFSQNKEVVEDGNTNEKGVEFILNDELFNSKSSDAEIDNGSRSKGPFGVMPNSDILNNGDRSIASFSTLGFEDEDEISILEGSRQHLTSDQNRESHEPKWVEERQKNDIRRELATEQIYWPFHRYYEIDGQRRAAPLNVPEEEEKEDEEETYDKNITKVREKWALYNFETPLSERKDGGFAMDATNFDLPMKLVVGKKAVRCDGKIFYMGIIDVLQQFNVRKRLEARWRRMLSGNWEAASCVHPNVYAARFLRFFDEYAIYQKSFAPEQPLATDEEEVRFSHASATTSID